MIGKRWKEKQDKAKKKETVKIFKKCCCGMCGRVAIQKAVEVNYRAVCLEVYFRIPAFSYTYLYHHTISLYTISYIISHNEIFIYYFTIGVVCCGMHVVKNTLIFEPRCPNCLLYDLKRYCKREKLVGTICK